jgi:hypothetical protein
MTDILYSTRLPDIDVPLNYKFDYLPDIIEGVNVTTDSYPSSPIKFYFQPNCQYPSIFGTVLFGISPFPASPCLQANKLYGIQNPAEQFSGPNNGSLQLYGTMTLRFSSIGTDTSYSNSARAPGVSSDYNWQGAGNMQNFANNAAAMLILNDAQYVISTCALYETTTFGQRGFQFLSFPVSGPYADGFPYDLSVSGSYVTGGTYNGPLMVAYQKGFIQSQTSGELFKVTAQGFEYSNTLTGLQSSNQGNSLVMQPAVLPSKYGFNIVSGCTAPPVSGSRCFNVFNTDLTGDVSNVIIGESYTAVGPSGTTFLDVAACNGGFITVNGGASDTWVFNSNMTSYAKINYTPKDPTAAYALENIVLAFGVDEFGVPIAVGVGDNSSTLPNYAFFVLAPLSLGEVFSIPVLKAPQGALPIACINFC